MNELVLLLLAAASVAVIFALAFLDRVRPVLIYSIPAINALAAVLVLEDRDVGSFHFGFVRVIVMAALILLMLPRLRLEPVTLLILGFVAYMLLLVPGATEPSLSFQGTLRPAISLLMLPVAYAYFRQLQQLRHLHLGIMTAVVVLLTNFGLAQVFKFGQSPYDKHVHLGEGAVTMAYVFAYALILLPLLYRLIPSEERLKRLSIGVLMFAALVAMLLVFRRGALLGLGAGLGLFVLLSPAQRSARFAKFGIVAALLFLSTSSYYVNTVEKLYSSRGDVAAFVGDTERGRMAEFGLIYSRLAEGSLQNALFGEEPFNSRRWLGEGRPLHVDYMNLIYSTGLVGLFLYLSIHLAIGWGLHRRARRSTLPEAREMRDTGFAIMAASLTISFSTQIYVIASLSIVFFYLGALLGVLRGTQKAAPPVAAARVQQVEALAYA